MKIPVFVVLTVWWLAPGVPGVPRPQLGGQSGLPPNYLSVDGHQDCLVQFEASSTHQEVCIPLTRRSECNNDVWQELAIALEAYAVPQIGGDSLPPTYLEIQGHEDCLVEGPGCVGCSHTVLCRPSTKPDLCIPDSWDQILADESVYNCELYVQEDDSGFYRKKREEPPKYLSIDGHEYCLDEHYALCEGCQHTEACLPSERPSQCDLDVWDQLLQPDVNVFDTCSYDYDSGYYRKKREEPPQYLSIDGHENCLDEHYAKCEGCQHTEVCLPSERPSHCDVDVWDQLLHPDVNVFDTCSYDYDSLSIVGGDTYLVPEKFHHVPNFGSCIEFASTTQKCVPLTQPQGCPDHTFQTLKELVFSPDYDY